MIEQKENPMGMYVHLGPFSFGGRARHTGPSTRQVVRETRQSFRDLRAAFTRGGPESKKSKRLRREVRRETTRAVQEHRANGTIT